VPEEEVVEALTSRCRRNDNVNVCDSASNSEMISTAEWLI